MDKALLAFFKVLVAVLALFGCIQWGIFSVDNHFSFFVALTPTALYVAALLGISEYETQR